ncbi:MAG: hypothetical protein GQ544_00580, partial [Candidatus Aminicenantes bacterium]|nr:hypothetical protein [Candidatus Aminicenantes bacterium]
AEIFVFCKKSGVYAVGWTDGKTVNYKFPGKVKKIMAQEGDEIPVSSQEVVLDRHPKYVVFEKD